MKNLLLAIITCFSVSVVSGQDGTFHLDEEYPISRTATIFLDCTDANVFITGSDRSGAHVKVDRKVESRGWGSGEQKFSVKVEQRNGNLHIEESKSGSTVSVGYYREDYKIELAVPQGTSLTVRGDDGDYFIKNVNGAISLSLDDADAELVDCGGDQFKFRFDDGDLRMNRGRGTLVIDADDSDVEIYNAQFASIDADVDDGDLVIETTLKNDGQYNLGSQDGLISLNITGGGGEFAISHDDGSVSASSAFKKLRESEHETRLVLEQGKAMVKLRADDARIKLVSN